MNEIKPELSKSPINLGSNQKNDELPGQKDKYICEVFFNDVLADVNEKVKDMMKEYQEVKKQLAQKESQKLNASHLFGSEELRLKAVYKTHDKAKEKFIELAKPIRDRQDDDYKLKQELKQFKQNNPTQKKQIPRKKRKGDKELNLKFLDSVV